MRYAAAILILIVLAGCEAATQHNHQADTFPQTVPVAAPPVAPPHPEVTRADLDGAVRSIRTETQASNNAMQNSLTGLGANVGKVAEKVDASLVRIDATANTALKATAEIKTELNNQIEAQASFNAQAFAQFKADTSARLDAIAQAQAQGVAGWNNKLDSMQQTLTAGRDAINTTQYSKEMQETIISTVKQSAESQVENTRILCGVIVVLAELSRRRAEKRAKGAGSEQTGGQTCSAGLVRRAWRALY